MTYICVGKLPIIGSDNGLSLIRRQAIIWTNAGILLNGHLGTNFNEILIGIQTFFILEIAFENVVCKMTSILSRPKWVNPGPGIICNLQCDCCIIIQITLVCSDMPRGAVSWNKATYSGFAMRILSVNSIYVKILAVIYRFSCLFSHSTTDMWCFCPKK